MSSRVNRRKEIAMKKVVGIALITVALSVLVGCTNEDIGMTTGAVAGGVIGSQFGHGAGNVAATVGGTLVGGYIGREVGKNW